MKSLILDTANTTPVFWATEAARECSDYLTLGMHHNTPEGQLALARLIEEASTRNTAAEIVARAILGKVVREVIAQHEKILP